MKWITVKNSILKYIDEQNIKPGDPLPPDKFFAEKFGVSLQPVIKAMQYLESHQQIARGTGRATIFLSRQPVVLDSMRHMSFSRNAREVYKVNLETKLIELSKRIPLIVNDAIDEKKVQEDLELSSDKPFLVIARLRFIDGKPRVIHRTYLNPERFPDDFLIKHDFEKESLIDIYSNYGYEIIYRNTSITARFPTNEEKKLFKIEDEKLVPVLSTYQHLISVEKDEGSEFVLEVLYATYLDWKFNVERHTETLADK